MSTLLRRVLPAALLVIAVMGALPSTASAAPLEGAKGLAARSQLTCVALTNGQARCWGEGDRGQLGHGAVVDHSANPVTVINSTTGSALTGVAQVSVGRVHACARLNNGRVRCWGANTLGQLGDATNAQRTRAVLVRNAVNSGPMENVAQISVGANHTCARLNNGQVRCWGMNSFGQLGTGNTTGSALPKTVRSVSGDAALTSAAQITTGERHSCARRTNGQVRCWGENGDAQLGDGTTTDSSLPRTVIDVDGVGALTGVAQIAGTNDHMCARLTNGQARCWGTDDHGERGDGSGVGDPAEALRPSVVDGGPPVDGIAPALTGVAQVSAGGGHSCFRMTNQQLLCTGSNANGQLGDLTAGSQSDIPMVVSNQTGAGPLMGVAQVATGGSHTCTRMSDSGVLCWGSNLNGQLGNGGGPSEDLPVAVQTA